MLSLKKPVFRARNVPNDFLDLRKELLTFIGIEIMYFLVHISLSIRISTHKHQVKNF